ncbi:MAG: hypothetical protein IPH39_20925 [Sulfuritalea sp.]|jgi:hypothetical protein|nr:hypothetical protein [Sulfuritalea sp.]MBK8762857.1 hypothetical protein [Sulfuritalea sp.]MBK9350557.1 hypothetical protein [Sulfuritalea sp.]MBP6637265.1 hypothetical protein [Sulfuritalea sp.]MBP7423356.1 hypothetical protein [Sulfuritalea sp.]
MNAKRPTSCWLATANAASRSIARAILTSQDITPLDLKPELLFAPHPAPGVQPDPEGILLLDLAPDCIGERGAAAALRQAQALPWRPRLLGFSGVARLPWANETGLARKLTGNPLLPRPESAPGEFMTSLLAQTGGGSVDATRLERHLRVLAGGGEQSADARILRMTGDSAAQLAATLLGAGLVGDRRYRLKKYPECLVGSAAVDWLHTRYRLRREDAAVLGDALMQAGYLHHVVKQQPFSDAEFFYRVAAPGRFDALPIEDVYALLRDTRGVVADRAWRGVSFPQCMVGGEVVDLLAGQYRLSRAEATVLGQSLLDLGMLRHVADEHPFADDFLFYELVTGLPPR